MKYSSAEHKFDSLKNWLRSVFRVPIRNKLDNKSRQESFQALDADTKYKLIAPHLDFYASSISKRVEVVPIMATLAATLIVVATLNTALVPLNFKETKVILSLLLLLIPTTLHFYVSQKEKAAQKALEIIDSYQGDNLMSIFDNASFFDHLSSSFPRIVIYFFYGIIFFILLRMWFAELLLWLNL